MENTIKYPYQNLSLKDMEGEVWRDINNYEGQYQVSNKGRVKSLARFVPTPQGGRFIYNDYMLKQNLRKRANKTYLNLFVALCSDGTLYHFSVARLVYSTFVKQLADFRKRKLYILHKDNNNLNNSVENLFLTTTSQKMKYYVSLGIVTPNYPNFSEQAKKNFLTARYKPVSQYSLEGKYLKTYKNISEAARELGIHDTSIGQNLRGKSRYAGGFLWKEGKNTEDIPPVIIIPTNKEIMQFTKEGLYITSYPSIREAERATGTDRSSISACTKGKAHSAGGFIWRAGTDPQQVKSLPLTSINSRTISQFDTFGNFMAVYTRLKDASQKSGISSPSLIRALKSKTRYAGGFLWMEGNQTGKKISPFKSKKRSVKQYDRQGNYMATYSSIAEAARAIGITSESIGNSLKGENKTSGGFIWRYATKN